MANPTRNRNGLYWKVEQAPALRVPARRGTGLWRGVACNARRSLAIFFGGNGDLWGVGCNARALPTIASPEGRTENSPGRLRCASARPYLETGCRDVGFAESGLQPWEGVGKKHRPERAADRQALIAKITFTGGAPIRTPCQGDFVMCVIPRAPGCSLFALRAMAKRPNPTFPWANSGGVASNTPAGMTALQTMTNSNGLCNFSAPESPEVGCPGVFRLGVETLYI
jgi:hypothetical protein